MRLIDANNVVKVLEALNNHNLDGKMNISNAIYLVESQKTAYDVDAVLKKLQEKSFMVATTKKYYDDPQNGEYVAEVVGMQDAFDIIKGGVMD